MTGINEKTVFNAFSCFSTPAAYILIIFNYRLEKSGEIKTIYLNYCINCRSECDKYDKGKLQGEL